MYFKSILIFYSVFNINKSSGYLENYEPLRFVLNILTCNHSTNLNLDVSGIKVFFYDFSNNISKEFPANKSAEAILALPNLDRKRKFLIYVNGFTSSIKEKLASSVRDTFKKIPNIYLIIMDHIPYTTHKAGLNSYQRAVQYVYYISKQLGQIMVKLYNGGISPKNLHGIGHSLGSHIIGSAGSIFFKLTNKKIGRISALDPAGPCFSNSLVEYHVRSGLADYVEVYHCNAGTFGSSSVLGDIDFFVNMGYSQPNCRTPQVFHFIRSAKAAQCSHKECVMIWLASVNDRKRYTAYKKCDINQFYTNNDCWLKTRTTAGFWNPGTATGVYYFSTEGLGHEVY